MQNQQNLYCFKKTIFSSAINDMNLFPGSLPYSQTRSVFTTIKTNRGRGRKGRVPSVCYQWNQFVISITWPKSFKHLLSETGTLLGRTGYLFYIGTTFAALL